MNVFTFIWEKYAFKLTFCQTHYTQAATYLNSALFMQLFFQTLWLFLLCSCFPFHSFIRKTLTNVYIVFLAWWIVESYFAVFLYCSLGAYVKFVSWARGRSCLSKKVRIPHSITNLKWLVSYCSQNESQMHNCLFFLPKNNLEPHSCIVLYQKNIRYMAMKI